MIHLTDTQFVLSLIILASLLIFFAVSTFEAYQIHRQIAQLWLQGQRNTRAIQVEQKRNDAVDLRSDRADVRMNGLDADRTRTVKP